MKVDIKDLTMAVRGLFLVAKIRYPEYKGNFPASDGEDAVEITDQDVMEFLSESEDVMVRMIKDRFGVDVPEVNPDDWYNPTADDDETDPVYDNTPDLPYIGAHEKALATVKNTGQKVSVFGNLQDKFVFEGKTGPDFGSSYTIVWSDGNRLSVGNSSNMTLKPAQDDARKFQPGGTSEIKWLEVYAKRGTHPDEVSIVVSK